MGSSLQSSIFNLQSSIPELGASARLPKVVPTQPEIALCVSTYEKPWHLQRVLASIAFQEGVEGRMELVVTDDGSTDDSAAVIRRLAGRDRRIRPFFRAHAGIGATDNAGVRAARGEWIARMDQDDVAMP